MPDAVESTSQQIVCPNCSSTSDARFRHCPDCGGKTRPQRLSFALLWGATIEHFLELDFPLARTFIGLCHAPGRVAREYIAGRRTHYTNPLKYNLITAVVIVLAAGWYLDHVQASLPQASPRTLQAGMIMQASALTQQWHNDYLQFVYVLTLPLLALMLRMMLGGRSRCNTMAFYIMLLYGFGQIYVFQATCIGMIWIMPWAVVDGVIGIISALSPFIYIPWMTMQFTGTGFVRGGLLSLLAFIVFSLMIGVLLMMIALMYVLLQIVPW